jgi:hypothetical protein
MEAMEDFTGLRNKVTGGYSVAEINAPDEETQFPIERSIDFRSIA